MVFYKLKDYATHNYATDAAYSPSHWLKLNDLAHAGFSRSIWGGVDKESTTGRSLVLVL